MTAWVPENRETVALEGLSQALHGCPQRWEPCKEEQIIFVVILANADIHGGAALVQAVCWPLPSCGLLHNRHRHRDPQGGCIKDWAKHLILLLAVLSLLDPKGVRNTLGIHMPLPRAGTLCIPIDERMVREPAGNEWAQSSSKELTRAWDMARPREGQQRTQWRIQKWKQGYAREQSDTLSDLKAISHWLAWVRKSFLDLNLEWPSVILSVDFHPIVISWQLTMLVVTLWSMNATWNIQYF